VKLQKSKYLLKAKHPLAISKAIAYTNSNTPATPLPSGTRNPGGFFNAPGELTESVR
jgi:hypothetical protein